MVRRCKPRGQPQKAQKHKRSLSFFVLFVRFVAVPFLAERCVSRGQLSPSRFNSIQPRAGKLEANRKLRREPGAVRHDDQNVVLPAMEIEQK